MKVFVYGTLQRGQGNHRLLRDAAFLGKAVTVRRFSMRDVGFPFIRPAPAGGLVVGELFDIGDCDVTLARLDRLESEGSMYDRVQGMVQCEGVRHLASFYVQHGDDVFGRPVPANDRGLLVWPKR